MLELPPLGISDTGLWDALLDIADRVPDGWTLIGGQMVLLHALERDRIPPRVSEDLDLVVDVRVRPPVLGRLVKALEDLGFTNPARPRTVSPTGFSELAWAWMCSHRMASESEPI